MTREVAKALADLAKSLEKDGHDPQVTAGFLQRCLFTMFAEDVELLPKQSFLDLLKIGEQSPAGFPVLLNGLWKDMATGANFSATIRAAVPHFNGGLFTDCAALPLRPDQILRDTERPDDSHWQNRRLLVGYIRWRKRKNLTNCGQRKRGLITTAVQLHLVA